VTGTLKSVFRVANTRGWRPWLIAGAVSAVLLALLGTQIEPSELLALATRLSTGSLGLAFVSYLAINCVIGFRLKLSFGPVHRIPFRRALGTTAIHSAMLAVLPARLGDLYYPVLLKTQIGTDIGASLGNLILLRLYDACAIAILFAISSVQLRGLSAGGDELIILPAIVVFACATVIFLLDRLMVCSIMILIQMGRRRRIIRRLIRVGVDGRRWLLTISTSNRLKLFSLTLVRWILAMVTLGLIFRSIGLELDFAKLVFVGAGLNLALIIPVQTIGGFGVAEVSMAVLLAVVGLDSASAAAAALFSRLLWLLLPLSVAIIWYFAEGRSDFGAEEVDSS